MRIGKHLSGIGIALLTCIFGLGAYAEFQFIKTFFLIQPQQETLLQSSPPSVQAVPNIEAANTPMETLDLPASVAPRTDETRPVEFDASGDYYLAGEKPPKGFENLEYLEIVTRDYDIEIEPGIYGKPIPPKGSVRAARNYKFKFLAIGTRQIAFETEKIKGISYKFTGEFESRENSNLEGKNTVLEGRLIKIKDGKKLAETKSEFYFWDGC